MFLLYFLLILLTVLAVPLLTRWVAKMKGYSPMTWFFLGMFLNIFALLALIAVPAIDSTKEPKLKDLYSVKPHWEK